jgi:hypothetical protein
MRNDMIRNESKPAIWHKRGAQLCACLLLSGGWLFYADISLKAQSFQTDLGLYEFEVFSPTILLAGDHPTLVIFDLFNRGFDSVQSDTPLNIQIFLSRDNTFGNADDISIGQMKVNVDLPWPSNPVNVKLDANFPSDIPKLANFTIPANACGSYLNMYMVVTFAAGSNYTDPWAYPNSQDNVGSLGFRSQVSNPTGPPPTIASITILSSAADSSSVTWQVTFSEAVTGVDSADFTLTQLSGSLSGYGITSLQLPSANRANVIASTGSGSGVLRLDVRNNATINNSCGVRMNTGFTSGAPYTINRTGTPQLPQVAGVVVPSQSNGPVASVDVLFSTPIDINTFTYQDVVLTRDGTPVALDATIVAGFISGTTYRINGLATFTAGPGSYILTVTGGGIMDPSGNAVTGAVSGAWNNSPSPNAFLIYVNRGYAGSIADGSVSFPFQTVVRGYQAVQAGGTMRIFGGSYPEQITMNKAVRLEATNGVVTIGR